MPPSWRERGLLISRQGADGDEGNSLQLIYTFISFHLFGLFGNIIMLLTVYFARGITRHSTWFSFSFSWVISAISYSLLFLAGRLVGSEPEFGLCLIQAIMIYSAPPLTAATSLALVIQIWFLVRSIVVAPPHNRGGILTPIWSTSLLVVPYLIYITIMLVALVIGLQTPSTVQKVGSGMYCNFSNRVPGRFSTILVALIMIPTLVLEVQVCTALRKNWSLFKHKKDSLPMIFRVMGFTFLGVFAIVLSLIFFFKIHHGANLNIIISLVPIATVLIFATQNDLIQVWMFWKKEPQRPQATVDVNPKIRKRDSVLLIG